MERDVLTIESIVAGGDGLARHPDGFVVFVERAAPGERVEVEYTESHKQYRRALVTEILEPSPARRDAPCPHYDHCGGCQLQHLGYDAQVAAKGNIVADALRRIGKLEVKGVEVEPSPRDLGYRNRVSFVVTREGETVSAGFHHRDDPARVVDIDRCPLAEPAINDAWEQLRSVWGDGAELLPSGEALRVTLRATARGEVGLAVEGGLDAGEPARLVELVPALSSVWSLGERGEVLGWAGEETLVERAGVYDIPLAGTAFIQVNRDVADKLDAHARAQCGAVDGERVVDAYCGYGVRALELARAGANVTAIDFDRGAIAAAKALAKRGGHTARFIAARVEKGLREALPAGVVILNPPRRGVGRDVIRTLLSTPPRRIVYVSCDPATLARDIRALAPAFSPTTLKAFDLFPQTSHVETVATLERR